MYSHPKREKKKEKEMKRVRKKKRERKKERKKERIVAIIDDHLKSHELRKPRFSLFENNAGRVNGLTDGHDLL